MKKLLIIISIFLAIFGGFVYIFPATATGSMSGIMLGPLDDCLMDCLKNSPIETQNYVTTPVFFGIIIGVVLASFILLLVRLDRALYKFYNFDRLYLFKTVTLKE